MRENRKKGTKGSDLGVTAERAGTASLQDGASSKLKKAASAVGNEELQRRIEKGNVSRDEMLVFMVDRLQTIRTAQLRELDVAGLDRQREWWKEVADSHKTDATKPDPTRWREVAQVYEEASYQICRGALGRGRDLLERGIEAEKREWGTLTSVVQVQDLDTEVESPDALDRIQSSDACGATDVPQEIRALASDIENVTHIAREPPGRKRRRDPWWTLWEDEEEEEDAAGGEG